MLYSSFSKINNILKSSRIRFLVFFILILVSIFSFGQSNNNSNSNDIELIIQKEKHKKNLLEQEVKYHEALKEIIILKNQKQELKIYSILLLVIFLLLFFLLIIRIRELKRRTTESEFKFQKILKNQELKRISYMIEGQEKERIRIARDLHDRLGSILSMVKINYKSIEDELEYLKDGTITQYKKANQLLDEACESVRQISHNMLSGTLSKFGLPAALEDLKNTLVESGQLEVALNLHGLDDRLKSELEIQIYRIIQELINNVLKHARARKILIQIISKGSNISIIFEDDGKGFNIEKIDVGQGMGLKEIKSRIFSLNGTFYINSIENKGTVVNIEIPIHTPEGIIKQGREAVMAWSKSGERVNLYEAKIILIGKGGVGKTTIKENLRDKNYKLNSHESTKGLDICEWVTEIEHKDKKIPFKFNIWDFGGQGKYRAIQQFFCSPKSLYIYVSDVYDNDQKTDDNYIGFQYWMEIINTFGKNKNNISCPVIYVFNKIDLDPDYYFNLINKERANLFEHYGVTQIAPLSCATSKGLDDLKQKITSRLEYWGEEIFTKKYPKNWIKVKKELESLHYNYISLEDYEKICETNNVISQNKKFENSEANILLNTLCEIGAVIYFKDVNYLKNIIILKPEWLRKAAYNILDCDIVIKNKGYFTKEHFQHIWENNTRDERDRLIELMKAFDLCYEDSTKKQYYIPALFPIDPPNNHKKYEDIVPSEFSTVVLKCYFKPFIPAGILHKIMFENNGLIYESISWQNGVVLKLDEAYLCITEDWKNNLIQLEGKGKNISKLIARIINDMKQILTSKYESKIFIEPYLIHKNDNHEYLLLEEQMKAGIKRTYSKHYNSLISISSLVNGTSIEILKDQDNLIRELLAVNDIKNAILKIEDLVNQNLVKHHKYHEYIKLLTMFKSTNHGIIENERSNFIDSDKSDKVKNKLISNILDLLVEVESKLQ